MHLQQLKGMQSSKRGTWKRYHLSLYTKGLIREKWYIKGKGLDLGRGGASPYKNLLSTPPGGFYTLQT